MAFGRTVSRSDYRINEADDYLQIIPYTRCFEVLVDDISQALFGAAPYVSAVTFEADCDMEKDVRKDREIVNLAATRELDNEIIDALVKSELTLLFTEDAGEIFYQRIHALAELIAEKSLLLGWFLNEVFRFDLYIAVVFH